MIVGSRQKHYYYPSTDYKKIHKWLSCYGFDKPVIFDSPLPRFFIDPENICQAEKHNKMMSYDEFIKACEENPDKFQLKGVKRQ